MVRMLASTALYLLANAVGLLAAAWLLDGFHLEPLGFVIAVVIFTVAQALFGPFVTKVALQYAPALRGGIALVTTLVSLIITTLVSDGLRIEGLTSWLLAPVLIWAVVLVAAILLPMVLFRKTLKNARDRLA